LEEQDVIPRQPIVFDELAVDHSSYTPALETLDVTQPYRVRHTRLGEVIIEDKEEVANSRGDIF
jgi:hypothetical protein